MNRVGYVDMNTMAFERRCIPTGAEVLSVRHRTYETGHWEYYSCMFLLVRGGYPWFAVGGLVVSHALTWTRLSCAMYESNQVRLALFVPAYNAGNFIRRFALPKDVSHRSLSSIQLKLVKIGVKIVAHSRMAVFQMAEVAVSEKLFRSMLPNIHRLGRACARAPALSL